MSKRRIARGVLSIGVLMIVAAIVLFVLAIWTVGPNCGRLAGTGGVIVVVGSACSLFSAAWLDLSSGES